MNHLGCFEPGTRDTPSQSPAILVVAGARRFRALPHYSEERTTYCRTIRPKVRKSESPKVRKSESPKVRKSESPSPGLLPPIPATAHPALHMFRAWKSEVRRRRPSRL